MKKTLSTMAAIALLSSVSSVSVAQDQAKTKLNPWAQCGIGAIIFKDNGTAAAISNIIWDLGTTAVTSASASKDSCEGATSSVARFVTESYSSLEEDIVKGEGAHLNAMLNMMECNAGENTAVAIREDFTQVLASENYETSSTEEKAQQVFAIATSACSAS